MKLPILTSKISSNKGKGNIEYFYNKIREYATKKKKQD